MQTQDEQFTRLAVKEGGSSTDWRKYYRAVQSKLTRLGIESTLGTRDYYGDKRHTLTFPEWQRPTVQKVCDNTCVGIFGKRKQS